PIAAPRPLPDALPISRRRTARRRTAAARIADRRRHAVAPAAVAAALGRPRTGADLTRPRRARTRTGLAAEHVAVQRVRDLGDRLDRKSTRLNSSHVKI